MISKPSNETAEFWIITNVLECKNTLKWWRENAQSMTREFESECERIEKYLGEAAERLQGMRDGW